MPDVCSLVAFAGGAPIAGAIADATSTATAMTACGAVGLLGYMPGRKAELKRR